MTNARLGELMPIDQIQEYDVPVRRHLGLDSCAGLTIEKAWSDYDEVGVRFTDGTVFYAYDDESRNLDSHHRICPSSLVRLGLLTDERRRAKNEEERTRSAEDQVKRERKEYERLKAKFGDEP
jgi:hypothetical protein